MIEFRDTMIVELGDGLTQTRDGYLVGEGKIAKAGNVQMYLGSEIGLTGDEAGQSFGVYRDPEVIFDESSMMSLAGRPITRRHPEGFVDSKSYKKLSVGHVGGRIIRKGDHVVASMAIMDAEAVAEVASGATSLSAGYTVGLTRDSGVTPTGDAYQFRQSGELRFNHVAYLPENNPRAGDTKIGDSSLINHWGPSPVKALDHDGQGITADKENIMTLRTTMVDGLSIQTTDQGAQAIEKLQAQLSDAEKKMKTEKEEMDEKMKAKDAELAKVEAERDSALSKVLSDADISTMVAERSALIAQAQQIAKDAKFDGLSPSEIRRAVVVARLGDAVVAGKQEAYIDARYDTLVEDMPKKVDPVIDGIRNTPPQVNDSNSPNDARQAMIADMQSGGKKEA